MYWRRTRSGAAGGAAEALPEVGLQGGEGEDVAFGGAVEVVAGEGAGERQGLADLPGASRLGGPGGEVGVHGGVVEGGVDALPLRRCGGARPRRRGWRRPALQAPVRSASGAAGMAVGACRSEGSGDGLIGEVVAGAGGVGAGLAPAGDRAEDQPRMAGTQLLRREAQARQGAGTEAFEEDVGALQQRLQDRAARRLLEIEGDALDARQQESRQGARRAARAAARGGRDRPASAPRS